MARRRARATSRRGAERGVLIIVQNLPVPLDRRVWLECRALVAAGIPVSVICPNGGGDPPFEELEGVRIYKYSPARQADSVAGFAWEFGYSWIRTALLARRVFRRDGFTVIQACNPPDTYWLLARLYRRRGVRFVFDQHDLNPELYRSRFGRPSRLLLRGLLALEAATFRTADLVISTNDSYRVVAITRGRCRPESVTVVRSGPDVTVMTRATPRPELRRGRDHLCVWLGIMGPQDGVDAVLRIADELVHQRGRTDISFALLGFGDCLEDLRAQCRAMHLDEYVTFTGQAGKEMIRDYLSTADLGLGTDPLSPLNELSTMNKVLEYMAFELPVVSFRLKESVTSAADAGWHVPPGDESAFADAVEKLLGDRDRRSVMGREGRARIERLWSWQIQEKEYVGAYQRLLDDDTGPAPST